MQEVPKISTKEEREKAQKTEKIDIVSGFLNNPNPSMDDVRLVRIALRDDFEAGVENPLYDTNLENAEGFNELKKIIREAFPSIYD